MIKLIRSNQKVFLAGLMIFSMLAFLVQRGSSNEGGSASSRVYGTTNTGRLYASELVQARAELQAVTHSVSVVNRDQLERYSMLDIYFGRQFAQAISSKPEWFLLLIRDANDAGVQVSNDQVEEVLTNYAKDPTTGDPLTRENEIYPAVRAGVIDVVKIRTRFEQIADAIKISKPQVDNLMAHDESLSLNLVQLSASDYLTKVPAPTTQAVADQFAKFSDSPPHTPVKDANPFGFGYKLPLREKLQYIRVSIAAVNTAVANSRKNYDWEVAARKYYLNDPKMFDIKPVTTSPAAAPLGPEAPGATTKPSIPQTYEQAHDRVMAALRQPLITTLMDQVRSYISATLNSDYQAYLKYYTDAQSTSSASAGAGANTSATAPSGAEPDSSLGVRYSAFAYISKLIDAVKDRFKVGIIGSEMPAYLSTSQIGDIAGVGSKELTKFVDDQALNYLAKANAKDITAPAVMMKPSPPLPASNDPAHTDGIIYARLSGVLASQAPPDAASVQREVEADVRLQEAYQMILKEAEAIRSAAKTGNLATAAIGTGHQIIPVSGTDAVNFYTNDIKGIYPPLGDAAPAFMKQAFQLTGSYNPQTNPAPILLIELPNQGRVFVAQMTDLKADWNEESYFRTNIAARGEEQRHDIMPLQADWLSFEAVSKRVGFVMTK